MNISFPVYTRLNEVLFKKKTLPSALLEAKKTITLTPNEEEEIKKETVVSYAVIFHSGLNAQTFFLSMIMRVANSFFLGLPFASSAILS